MELEIKDFEYYLVFLDSKDNYVISYGYEERPAVIDIKYAFDQLPKEEDLKAAIPNLEKVFDYISVDIMNHDKFLKYMEKQEKKAAKAEKKMKKKGKKKNA